MSNTYFRKGFLNFTMLCYGALTLYYAKKNRDESYSPAKDLWMLIPAAISAVIYFTILGLWMTNSFTSFTFLQIYNRCVLVTMGILNIPLFLQAMKIASEYPVEKATLKNLVRVCCLTGIISMTIGVLLSLFLIINNIPFGWQHQIVRTVGALGAITACLAIGRYALLADRPRVFSVIANELELPGAPKMPRAPQLSGERQKQMYDQLSELVKEDRLFLDPDLNMEKLTSATGYSRHQISEVLNHYGATSFYPFINRFRVDEVCKQMQKAALKTNASSVNMLDLSYVCGFKSKSSFNEYFRRYTGQTPSEYWGKLTAAEKKV
ncbi:MAG: helix-turn-helix transcriptional regulator [Chitinophagaceae bacterium]|nr:helix-turn-helix transcriptional regulator [Chitinophagaceae bacterium]